MECGTRQCSSSKLDAKAEAENTLLSFLLRVFLPSKY